MKWVVFSAVQRLSTTGVILSVTVEALYLCDSYQFYDGLFIRVGCFSQNHFGSGKDLLSLQLNHEVLKGKLLYFRDYPHQKTDKRVSVFSSNSHSMHLQSVIILL